MSIREARRKVREFNRKFGQIVGDEPAIGDAELIEVQRRALERPRTIDEQDVHEDGGAR